MDTLYYIETIRNIASNGYAVVYVPYRSIFVTMSERYATLYDGFLKAARTFPSIIDTTQVGFYGHSLGGGAVPRIAYRLFTENDWGENGKFIYCSAPYYTFELGSMDLESFPTDCKMLTVLFDNDDVNDQRIGIDIFNNIAIGKEDKDFITVFPDTVSGYNYDAEHSLSVQYTSSAVFDAHDYYVTFRLLSALADYTFTGNPLAKDVALGNGSPVQVNMGAFPTPLGVTDHPFPTYPESFFSNPCSDPQNERSAFCPDIPAPSDCPKNKDFEDEDLTIDSTYTVAENITTRGMVIITEGTNITFDAGEGILLQAGFIAEEGSNFIVTIGGCTEGSKEITSRNQQLTVSNILDIYPNPLSDEATVVYQLSEENEVSLYLYNLSGQLVKTLEISANMQAGVHQLNFRKGDLESGVYIIVLQTDWGVWSTKIAVI